MALGKCGNTEFAGIAMKHTDLKLLFALCLTFNQTATVQQMGSVNQATVLQQ
jgi:hypothetical protein